MNAALRSVAILCLAIGGVLLAINIYGANLTMRSPLVVTDPTDFSHERILSEDEAWTALDQLDRDNGPRFAMQATSIIGQAIKHERISGTSAPDARFKTSLLTIPIWENYWLFALSYVWPAYRSYEFINYRRALRRGIGQCGQQALAVVGFLEDNGFNTGFAILTSHIVAMAEVEPGKWYVLDPDFGVTIPHTIEEVASSETLVENYYKAFDEPSPDGYLDPWFVYSSQPPELLYGGPSVRRPKGSVIEPVLYFAKWAFPIFLILISVPMLRSRRHTGPRSSPIGPSPTTPQQQSPSYTVTTA